MGGDRVTWSDGMYRVFGLRHGEFDGTLAAYLELVHPDDRDRRGFDLERLLERGEVLEAQQRIRDSDGQIRWISSRVKVVRGPSGEAQRLVGVCRDVTAERSG